MKKLRRFNPFRFNRSLKLIFQIFVLILILSLFTFVKFHYSESRAVKAATSQPIGEAAVAAAAVAATGNPQNAKKNPEVVLVQPINDSILYLINKKKLNVKIQNEQQFPNFIQHRLVILIQIHNRASYLNQLIQSLKKVKGIDETLVIFSHDFYSDELNTLVESVDFCPVLQLFYPHSIQLNPNRFPGQDPNDCPRDISKENAKQAGCLNADNPDAYGHYRQAEFTQVKHHWFWKLSYVFDKLEYTKKVADLAVLLLEEDYYLAPDALHMLKLMRQQKSSLCPQCSIVSVGSYETSDYAARSSVVSTNNWISSKHNMGMSIDREAWSQLKACAETFCKFDDYNWDWSLQFSGMTCWKAPIQVLYARTSRVFHIGQCGIHHKGTCDPSKIVEDVNQQLAGAKLFPSEISLESVGGVKMVPKPNGGWGDPRDHKLCMSFIQ